MLIPSSTSKPRLVALLITCAVVVAAAWGSASPSGNASTVTTISGTTSMAQELVIPAGHVLRFDPDKDSTLEIAGNVVVRGVLEMRPRPGVTHTLRFVDVDESLFVGGGMEVLGSDRGLWVMGDGRLDVVGEKKTGWNRTGIDPTWKATDELLVSPTATDDHGETGFQPFSLGSPVPQADPTLPPAEVLNLTRSVRIEGTDGGRSHVFIMSSAPQTIRYAQFRHMGPRQPTEDGYTEGVPGRYPLHFHHSGDGSRGSIVEGNVVRESGNRAFVPHASHGVILRDNIAYDVFDTPYWWDPGDEQASHDSLWEHNLAGHVRSDPVFRGYTMSGFHFGRGDGNVANSNAAVGVLGNKNCSGFHWPSQGSGLWEFNANVAHNNKCHGIFVWQNSSPNHHINDFVAYRNRFAGVSHGAYTNNYVYTDLYLHSNGEAGIVSHAFSHFPRHGLLPQTWSCVTVVGSPLALSIAVSNAPQDGAPAQFEYLVVTGTPTFASVEEAAAKNGQTLDTRASFAHQDRSCGTFVDDNESALEPYIEAIAAAGITHGCNPPSGNRFCPGQAVTRGEMAAFLVRAFGLPPASRDYFDDDDGQWYEDEVNAVAAAGITLGVSPNSYAPQAQVTRAQMASFLARAMELPGGAPDAFADDDGNPHEQDIDALAAAGVTTGTSAAHFSPHSPVTREQMAAFLARATGLLD
jgi:hypothetical protein